MTRLLLIALISCCSVMLHAQPLPVVNNHAVIIDTDCALDDMRALAMMLSRPEIDIRAVLCSDGSVTPENGVQKVLALLHDFNADSIPVVRGNEIKSNPPSWRELNNDITWGKAGAGKEPEQPITDNLGEILFQGQKTTLICLGPLTNIAKWIIKQPKIVSAIERIIWYNEFPEPELGFNFCYDSSAAGIVFRSGIRMDIVSNLNKERAFFDMQLMNLVNRSDSPLARQLQHVYRQPAVADKLLQNHFRMCDDLTVIYLLNPELFNVHNKRMSRLRYVTDYHADAVREVLSDMIRDTYVNENNIVFTGFPDQKELFRYDIRPIIDSVIMLYGKDEWKANVMTDEFHGHLGVFSIVGAKMGIKAREIFHVGPDELKVISYAGSRPPYSCLNDGIQVSTGATVGMGTFTVAPDTVRLPSAVFCHGNKSVKITLRQEYLDQVEADINLGIVEFGLSDDGYWKLIRRNAIRYWLEWDRNKIFTIEDIQ